MVTIPSEFVAERYPNKEVLLWNELTLTFQRFCKAWMVYSFKLVRIVCSSVSITACFDMTMEMLAGWSAPIRASNDWLL
jgi:hypothetical protein